MDLTNSCVRGVNLMLAKEPQSTSIEAKDWWHLQPIHNKVCVQQSTIPTNDHPQVIYDRVVCVDEGLLVIVEFFEFQ